MDKQKLVKLLFLLTFPAAMYVILATGEINFIRLPYIGERDLAPNGKDTIYHTVPPFSFVNQDGKIITDKDYEGKIYVVDFFFTSCGSICPIMTTELLRIQEKFAYTDGLVQIISHTVDPENDSIPVLKAYSKMVHADTKTWNFVTGEKKELYDIARHGYLVNAMEGDGGPDDFIHSEYLVLVDKEKHIRAMYDGTDIGEVNKMIDDIKVLLAEYHIKEGKGGKENQLEIRPKKDE